jgi:hypothetical protein
MLGLLVSKACFELDQLSEVLGKFDVSMYQQPIPQLDDTSIGKHVRHTVEFFQTILNLNDTVCYDLRNRTIDLELCPKQTISELKSIKKALAESNFSECKSLKVIYGGEEMLIDSNVERELTFLIEHTVHHLAIIRIGMNIAFPSIELPKFFGYADSTIEYLKSQTKAV